MVGLDLALSGGKTYSNYSANGESTAVIDEKVNTLRFSNVPKDMERVFEDKGQSTNKVVESLLSLPGYFGGTVPTRTNYYSFHGGFVQLAKIEASTEYPIPLINSTEGGAYIEGFDHISLQDVIDKYDFKELTNVRDSIDKQCKAVDFGARTRKADKAKEYMRRSISKTMTLAQKCKKLASIKNPKLKQEMQLVRYETELIASVGKTPFISLPNIEKVKRTMEIYEDAENINEVNGVAIMIYDIIENSATDVLTILGELEGGFKHEVQR